VDIVRLKADLISLAFDPRRAHVSPTYPLRTSDYKQSTVAVLPTSESDCSD